ncbi:LysR substrate-binding domain-containing protein [Vibrio sp. SS-MA-C1-2]|uniref:LysR substrate-binding domain-containing protein n=1 Tax=Vibrio sp. SS-MA-C1-2 TaxID=2908646 RepID=UPI001F238E6B|nr:LysR substrate-binding domain-containing protein [Vibrio sp. SS-MA-C1-2]UJF17747.1 LysR substrate-binding domain-containing protein [Vibrio sp. SS-MA-C1-2]
MKNSDLSLIPFFIMIMEERSLSVAAKKMNLSQPAVSAALSKLRYIYRDQLFNRLNYGVEPTPYAYEIFPILSNIMNNYMLTIPTEEFNPAIIKCKFKIATLSVSFSSVISNFSRELIKQSPNITIETQSLLNKNLENDLINHKFDLAINIGRPNIASLNSHTLGYHKLVVVCAREHPRIKGSHISPEQFMAEKHAVHTHIAHDDNFKHALSFNLLRKRDIRWYAKETTEMLSIIEKSELIGLVTEEIAKKLCGAFNLKYFNAPLGLDKLPVSIIWHSSRENDIPHKWLRGKVINSQLTF